MSISDRSLFFAGDLEGEADPASPSFLSFLDMDSLVIFLAFVFWALLISTFFKEWGAIKNLQPREISRRPAPYPHNVSDVKVCNLKAFRYKNKLRFLIKRNFVFDINMNSTTIFFDVLKNILKFGWASCSYNPLNKRFNIRPNPTSEI